MYQSGHKTITVMNLHVTTHKQHSKLTITAPGKDAWLVGPQSKHWCKTVFWTAGSPAESGDLICLPSSGNLTIDSNSWNIRYRTTAHEGQRYDFIFWKVAIRREIIYSWNAVHHSLPVTETYFHAIDIMHKQDMWRYPPRWLCEPED